MLYEQLPVMDGVLLETENGLKEFAGSFFQHLKLPGAVRLKNSGIPLEHMAEVHRATQELFRCAHEEGAERFVRRAIGYERGYCPLWEETYKGAPKGPDEHRIGNYSEFWHIGLEKPDLPNVLPESLSNHSRVVLMHHQQCVQQLFVKLMRAFALHLGLPTLYFEDHAANGETLLRVIRRPPVTDEARLVCSRQKPPFNIPPSAWPHNDTAVFTALSPAKGAGLWICILEQDSSGRPRKRWVKADNEPNEAVIYPGYMCRVIASLAGIATNIVTHMVLTSEEAMGEERFSFPGFGHTVDEMDLLQIYNDLEELHHHGVARPKWMNAVDPRWGALRYYGPHKLKVIMSHFGG